METIQEKVIAAIAKVLDREEAEIQLEQRMEEDLMADSLDAVEIAMELENTFHILITDQELFDDNWKTKTVNDIIAYINQRLAE